ncbi:MAG: hypothetical protein AAGA48_30015 [Myxococcota bacterium]
MMRWLLIAVVGPPIVLGLLIVGFFAVGPSAETRAERMFDRQVTLWEDRSARAESTDALRSFNPEWDLMWRLFLVLAVSDHALAGSTNEARWLSLIDSVIEQTLADEADHGQAYFLLPYVQYSPFQDPSKRSLFVDGEIALMMGARRLVRDDRWGPEHRQRVDQMTAQFARSPAGLPESYPDEAWLFCNTNALVAIRMADVLDGTDHRDLIESWTENASTNLVDESSGLLGSEFTWSAEPLDGPEGSSLWLVAVNLQLLDAKLAEAQYAGARRDLLHGLLGLMWATEWGPDRQGPHDIDSGPIVPLFEASPSSSGFALLAAHAFDDGPRYRGLTRALRAADVVLALDPRFAEEIASNPMGEVVLLHGLTFGPLWERVGPLR